MKREGSIDACKYAESGGRAERERRVGSTIACRIQCCPESEGLNCLALASLRLRLFLQFRSQHLVLSINQ